MLDLHRGRDFLLEAGRRLGLTGSMALKRWVMKDAPCLTASSAWDRLASE